MKKTTIFLPALLGAAGLLLRLFQCRLAFEADTGLPVAHPLSLVLPVLLVAAAGLFLVLAWPSGGRGLDFPGEFPAGETPPLDLVCGALLYVTAGGLLIVRSVGGGAMQPLALGALAVLTGVSLLLALRRWREGEAPRLALLVPVFLALAWVLFTYQQYASCPVMETFYVPVLAQAATAYAFYQLAAFGFQAGRRRPLRFILPVAAMLCLTAVGDLPALPYLGLYLAGFAVLFAFWRSALAGPAEEDAEDTAETEGTAEQEEG